MAQSPDYFLVSFNRPTGTTHVAWARNATAVDLIIPAELDKANLVDMLGQTMLITPTDVGYELHLEGARCDEECLIGGPPIFVVEDEHHQFTVPFGEEMNLNSVAGLTDIDSQVNLALDSLPPPSTVVPTSQPKKSPTVTSEEDVIISDSQMDIQQMPESMPQTPTETVSGSDAYTVQSNDESTSTVGIWLIGLGLAVAAGLVLVVYRGHSVE